MSIYVVRGRFGSKSFKAERRRIVGLNIKFRSIDSSLANQLHTIWFDEPSVQVVEHLRNPIGECYISNRDIFFDLILNTHKLTNSHFVQSKRKKGSLFKSQVNPVAIVESLSYFVS